ncbi:hypothetical protein PoB_000945300 [Plakobranchus ocellatus]|uniref:ZP domain-containing protein n=1 Tax=Plakobranchus ocellatus TaxID=259542 RepID=A0AAV3YKR6_9GAST|nr:hypothetical protein PoB_000945300 [Plakobranchus ocellatus]
MVISYNVPPSDIHAHSFSMVISCNVPLSDIHVHSFSMVLVISYNVLLSDIQAHIFSKGRTIPRGSVTRLDQTVSSASVSTASCLPVSRLPPNCSSSTAYHFIYISCSFICWQRSITPHILKGRKKED